MSHIKIRVLISKIKASVVQSIFIAIFCLAAISLLLLIGHLDQNLQKGITMVNCVVHKICAQRSRSLLKVNVAQYGFDLIVVAIPNVSQLQQHFTCFGEFTILAHHWKAFVNIKPF